jgi:hypothetical protein
LKKNYFSSHKLPKQQLTSFWSQGILGVKGINISVFSAGNQATFVASGDWPHWCIFGGNSSHLLQK